MPGGGAAGLPGEVQTAVSIMRQGAVKAVKPMLYNHFPLDYMRYPRIMPHIAKAVFLKHHQVERLGARPRRGR